ncbi:MAG TPA: hypothetical protein VG737_14245, partial [Cyclobacteriaceae bacterium]|nr:hypothetical protein [Cyclobacteriaceae bacterium]
MRTLTGWAQIVAVIVGFVTLYVMVDQRLDQTDRRVDDKFGVIDRRLDRLEVKVDNMDARLTKLEKLVTLDLS